MLMVAVFLVVALVLGTGCAGHQTRHAWEIDPKAFLACYEENNQAPVPVAEYMIDAYPQVLIYPDGRLLVPDTNPAESSSGLLTVRLSPSSLTNVLEDLSAHEGFWKLENRYRLTRWTDQPDCHVTLRIPGHSEKTVGVYGRMTKKHLEDADPPQDFVEMVAALRRLRPEGLKAWDPGYVEVEFWDYSYAPGRSVEWPGSWPSLNGPLTREVKEYNIKVMIFPSELLPKLDSLLAQRSDYSAVRIAGWKAAVSYRWSMPGEKKWTSFR